MTLEEKINNDIKLAMRAKDKTALQALRAVKAAILLAKTEKDGGAEFSEDFEIKLLQKLVKQRKDSASIYKEQNRMDLYEPEINEASIIEKYLPEQLSAEEITTIIKEIITKTSATTMKDMGKVMGMASSQLAGKADGKTISTIVKSLLS